MSKNARKTWTKEVLLQFEKEEKQRKKRDKILKALEVARMVLQSMVCLLTGLVLTTDNSIFNILDGIMIVILFVTVILIRKMTKEKEQ
jgi:ABC-type protease/lipase transport system fused ATPase/permease subunit